MSFKVTVWLIALLLATSGALMGLSIKEERARQRAIWGPNPANVKFEIEGGGSGQMLVRDYDHATEEVEAYMNHTYAELKADAAKPDSRLKINGDFPPAKVKKIERLP